MVLTSQVPQPTLYFEARWGPCLVLAQLNSEDILHDMCEDSKIKRFKDMTPRFVGPNDLKTVNRVTSLALGFAKVIRSQKICKAIWKILGANCDCIWTCLNILFFRTFWNKSKCQKRHSVHLFVQAIMRFTFYETHFLRNSTVLIVIGFELKHI